MKNFTKIQNYRENDNLLFKKCIDNQQIPSKTLYYHTSKNEEQGKLYLSAFDQSIQDLALVSAERDILPIKVPIPSLYFSQQSAFGMLAIAK